MKITPSALATCLAIAIPSHAADVTLNAGDTVGTSSFNTVGQWSNAAVPAIGNNYFTGEFLLRTPTTNPGTPFAGNSLTIAPTTFDLNKSLMFKGPGYTLTIPNLTVNGGYIRHGEGDTQSFVLAGNLAIGANGARFSLQGPLEIASLVSGSETITIDASVSDPRTLTLSNGSNTYTGNVINAGRFALSSTGRLNFVIGESGVNNSISGAGPKTQLNGIFYIDLTNASSDEADLWTLVSTSTKSISLSNVTGSGGDWTLVGNSWRDPSGLYQFSQATGVLRVIPPDSDSDADHDLYTKLEEVDAGTDPDNVFSSPDSDADGLADGFEVFYFGDYQTENLATILPRQIGSGDADLDGYTNAQEAAVTSGPTDPTDLAFTPLNTDGDGLLDGWEYHHFFSLDEVASGNPDSDSANNLAEQLAGSDPNISASIPGDIDGNAILDVNEALQPYVADASTLHLWHLDELEATALNPAADAGSSPVPLTSLANGASLWQTSLPAFMTALDTSANRGTATGAVLSAKPLAIADADSVDPLVFAGADGAFTFEAIVRLDFDPTLPPASVKPMQIVTSDGEGDRLWQFRLTPLGAPELALGGATPEIQFIKIGGGEQQINAALPISAEPDAAVQGAWYHVAVAYNGNEATADNLKIYWTRMDASRSAAHEIGSAQLGSDIVGTKGSLTLGNEGRDISSGAGATDNFVGLIDEVRISSIARSATGFYFGGSDYDIWAAANGVSGTAGEDDDGDSLSNDFERLFGLDPRSGSSMDPFVVPFDRSTRQLSYTRRIKSATLATYSVWTSPDLLVWSKDTGASELVTGTVGEIETSRFTLSEDLTTLPKLFVRIQAN